VTIEGQTSADTVHLTVEQVKSLAIGVAGLASGQAPAVIGVDVASKPDIATEAVIDTATGKVLSVRTIEPEEVLVGSSLLPAVVDLVGGQTVQLGVVVAHAHELSGLTDEDWNALDGDAREGWIAAGLSELRDGTAEALGLVSIEAKSRDGEPYRRAGFTWSGSFQPQLVTHDQLKRLVTDRHLIVKY
jgi:hypothetical protein